MSPLVALALFLQCTHQLSAKVVKVGAAPRLRLLLLLALPIEGVVGLVLLLALLLLGRSLLPLLGRPLLSLMIEGMTILVLVGLIMRMSTVLLRVVLLLLVVLRSSMLVVVSVLSAPLLLLCVIVASHSSHCLLVVGTCIGVILLLLLVSLVVLLILMNRRWLLPMVGWVRRRWWEGGWGSLPALHGRYLRCNWALTSMKALMGRLHAPPRSCASLIHLPSPAIPHGQVPLMGANVHTAVTRSGEDGAHRQLESSDLADTNPTMPCVLLG